MNRLDPFERLLASLHDAALDDALWPAASRLTDEACGATGSSVIVGEGVGDDARVSFAAFYRRGERRLDLERDYYENYFHQKGGAMSGAARLSSRAAPRRKTTWASCATEARAYQRITCKCLVQRRRRGRHG